MRLLLIEDDAALRLGLARQLEAEGYRVGYEYRGQHYTTLMHENPGPNLQVRVSVEPVERY